MVSPCCVSHAAELPKVLIMSGLAGDEIVYESHINIATLSLEKKWQIIYDSVAGL